jgi:hypothetical protein
MAPHDSTPPSVRTTIDRRAGRVLVALNRQADTRPALSPLKPAARKIRNVVGRATGEDRRCETKRVADLELRVSRQASLLRHIVRALEDESDCWPNELAEDIRTCIDVPLHLPSLRIERDR